MYNYHEINIHNNSDENLALLNALKTKLPRKMRGQLTPNTQVQAYFLLDMLSDDACVLQLREHLQTQYKSQPSLKTPLEQALALISQLQESPCDTTAAFKYRLPAFLSEYPVHSSEVNRKINVFNRFIEAYHADEWNNPLDAIALDNAYQDLLIAIKSHYMGCNMTSLWQLLKAMSAWSAGSLERLLGNTPCLLSPFNEPDTFPQNHAIPSYDAPVEAIDQLFPANKQTKGEPFSTTFDYQINDAGRIADKSVYLSIHGFALKPGGHADAIAKHIPGFLPWTQWQSNIRRQLSQQIDLPLDEVFFDWLQTVLQRLGVEFVRLKESSFACYVSPFLNHKIVLNTLSEEGIGEILQEQCVQADITLKALHLSIISRYVIRLLHGFQFNRGQALGIGANWGGVVSDSNEANVDAFRFNDTLWAQHFRHLSLHRQGPAEALMDASIGIKYELQALLSSFEYMTQLQVSEYSDTLYNALVDNLVTSLFPEPPYFENKAYVKYRHQYAVHYTDEGMQQIHSFYQPCPQGSYYKTNKGDYKQTPMFRQAGSLQVEAFPRDTGSGECLQSLVAANPLWPLQLQYAQSTSTGTRGHLVYNPIGPDEFIPDTFYGQIMRESESIFVPFIGVVPKNFDKHFKQVELCASFVIRMLHSSRLMTYCPAFSAYYFAIAARFLPAIESKTPSLPSYFNLEIKRKWRSLDRVLHEPNRTAEVCHKAFFSLFKALIYSLYAFTKEESDLHYYFTELTVSPTAFEPQNRATCERFIRELTTLKPLQNNPNLSYYDSILHTLRELTDFFYPIPSDEMAKSIALQARLHVKPLLALDKIKEYFADLSKHFTANISPKVSPGLMHDALKYKGPSPAVFRDFYKQRHGINFYSGYRDVEGSHIVQPSTHETWSDIAIKTIGALLPLIHRNKTPLSLITQPFSQAYIAGYQSYCAEEQHKILYAMCSSIGGFFYGAGLGLGYALSSLPMTIHTSLFAQVAEQQKPNHALAISSAPSNEPGLRVAAIMDIRDSLLQLMSFVENLNPSIDPLINVLLAHAIKIHPSLASKGPRYKKVILEAFPLESSDWLQLFEPVIKTNNHLQPIINQYALQIDSVFIHALYECLTASNLEHNLSEVINTVIDKHKLKDPQDKALTAVVTYYNSDLEAKRNECAQYRFQGSAHVLLKKKEQSLRKIQTWINNALDLQWGLEALFHYSMDTDSILMNEFTLIDIVSDLPDSMKEVLRELISRPGYEKLILNKYALDEPVKAFLLQCSTCYKKIMSKQDKESILNSLRMREVEDLSLSIKAREHLKLTQFIQHEWHHQLLSMDCVQTIIVEIKKQSDVSYHSNIDALFQLYETACETLQQANAFDAFYERAMQIKQGCDIDNPLHNWVNVTMNGFMNLLLDAMTRSGVVQLENPLSDSRALTHWLNHLMTQRQGIRPLLAQQIEQADSFDEGAWRCQHILRALEGQQLGMEHIHGTGMQKLLRIICQNKNAITPTGEQKAKNVPISALCKYSITMQHALGRVREKIPNADFVRSIEVKLKGF